MPLARDRRIVACVLPILLPHFPYLGLLGSRRLLRLHGIRLRLLLSGADVGGFLLSFRGGGGFSLGGALPREESFTRSTLNAASLYIGLFQSHLKPTSDRIEHVLSQLSRGVCYLGVYPGKNFLISTFFKILPRQKRSFKPFLSNSGGVWRFF